MYTVTYDDQSATTSVSPGTDNIAYGSTVSSLPTDPVKTGYAFGGWFTEVNGGGTLYTTSTVVTGDITVYAKWTEIYTVTYDGNGSTGGTVPTDTASYTNDQEVTVLGNTGNLLKINVSDDSYRFVGWTNSSGVNYTNGATFTMGSANVTLYAKWESYVLRDVGPAGGLVFYDKGSYSGTPAWRYLEAAPSDQTSRAWGTYPLVVSGADGTAIGTGLQNTLDIIAGDSLANKAADECANLSITKDSITYDDWFLPSKDELNEAYVNLSLIGVGGFAYGYYYWSSSEYNNIYAWLQNFYFGNQGDSNKDDAYRVRAVRAF
jgi:uncharacterized repeat protein (TIGR02543 family)